MSKPPPAPDAPTRARSGKPRKKIKLPAKLREQDTIPGNRHWRTYFLAHLVVTFNVKASADEAGISPSRAYRTRQDDPDFAREWRIALAQGYENLEMELLGYIGGQLRWLDGPLAGTTMGIVAAENGALALDTPIDLAPLPGSAALLREGCDRTITTCATRFANAVNFQGEPFLPGNDLVTRYPSPAQ